MRSSRAPKVDQLKRRGYRVSENYQSRDNFVVFARRSRMPHDCRSYFCSIGKIEYDEVYVDCTDETSFPFTKDRFHIACALRAGIIEKESVDAVDRSNTRRAAIEEQKARRGIPC